LCGLGKVYEGAIALGEFARLSLLLTDTAGDVVFRLEFSKSEDKRNVVEVSVRATLAVQCQRCLGTVTREIVSTSQLAVVSGPAEAERLPDSLDPLLVEDDKVVLRDLIEDELILSIPNAPMHEPDECEVRLSELNTKPGGLGTEAEMKPRSPFAALAALKRDNETND
jgi:uncharacterized protein